MKNLLDDAEGIFVVLLNAEGQYSLWPEQLAVPAGWNVAHASDTRQSCLEYIQQHWTDMRPESLKRAMMSH
jgi:MbtH protein